MKILYDYAIQFVGRPYLWAGNNPVEAGMDCSGFVQVLLAAVGMDPPGDQTAQGLYNHFSQPSRFRIPEDVFKIRQLGALAFYGKDSASVTHVALLLDEKHVIEAGGGDSTTTTLAVAQKQGAYVRIRPLEHRKDLVAVLLPRYPV